MNSTPQLSRLERLHQRLTQSKYWSISLAVHAVVIAALSTIALVQHTPKEDLDFQGYTVPGPDQLPPFEDPFKSERPEVTIVDPAIPPQSMASNPPATNQPPTIPIDLRIAVVSTNAVGPVEIAPIPTLKPGEIGKAPGFVPLALGDRFRKDSRNMVMTGRGPGIPQPTDRTESSVLRGLTWLRDHQNKDGSWGERNKGAMTGLALLSFLGHGETGDSKEFGLTVNTAIQWVIDNGTKHEGRLAMTDADWGPGNGGVYEHGILTYALGEYFTLTRDERVLELLSAAVRHIVDGQGPDGGWMYRYDKTQSDTSVSGWQVQALKAAHLTKLTLPGVDGALDRAMTNFDRVRGPNGGYGYRGPEDRYSLTGVGLACQLFWKDKKDKHVADAVGFILSRTKEEPILYTHEKADLYAWYYHTQAMLMAGGPGWLKWEPQFREMCIKSQAKDGSWPVMRAAGHGNLQTDPNLTGAVYRTTLSVLMLEAYYRYLPSNQGSLSDAPQNFALR